MVDNSNSADNYGLLKATNVALDEDNAQLPIKTADGYVFVEVLGFNKLVQNGTKYFFEPLFETGADELLLENLDESGVSFEVHVSWTNSSGDQITQIFVFNKEFVNQVISSYNSSTGMHGKVFLLSLKNAENATGLTFTGIVVSDTDATFSSANY